MAAFKHQIIYDLKNVNQVEIDNLKKYHIQTAVETLRNLQKSGEFNEKNPRQRVDNVWDKALENVRFLGKIEFYNRVGSVKQVVLEIMQMLLENSIVGDEPNRYGIKYKQLHVIQINGVTVDTPADLDRFKFGDTIQIINLAPYARRLELLGASARHNGSRASPRLKNTRKGKDSRKRTVTLSKPNGAYALVHRLARSRFKQIGQIRFEFLPQSGTGLTFKPGRKKVKTPGKGTKYVNKRGVGRTYLYPSIKIIPDPAGVA